MVIRSIKKKQGNRARNAGGSWVAILKSDQDSLTEMVTTKGGEGDIRTSYRKVFRRENVKCKGSNGGAPGV